MSLDPEAFEADGSEVLLEVKGYAIKNLTLSGSRMRKKLHGEGKKKFIKSNLCSYCCRHYLWLLKTWDLEIRKYKFGT